MNRRTAPILLLTFVNVLGGTLLIPVLPFVVRDLGQSEVVFALLIAAYPAAQFFAAPVLGGMADHYGRRPVLIASQAGTLASWLLFIAAYFTGDALALGLIAASRIIDGLTGGNASVAAAYMADVTTDDERTRIFSFQGAIVGVGLIIGPALGSFAGSTSIGFLGPALLAAGISTIALAWLVLALPESLDEAHRVDELDLNPFHQLNLISRVRRLTGRDALVRLFGIQALFTFATSAYTTIVVLWYVDRLGISETNAGLVLLAVGVFLIFNELMVVPFAERRLGDLGTMLAGLTLLPVAFLLVRIPTSVWWFLPAAFVLNMGMALIMPTLQAIITKVADESEEGEVQGINTSVSAVASTFAPIAAGAIYASDGPLTLIVIAIAAGVGTVFALASAPTIAKAMGLERPAVRHHRRHGPIVSLAHRRSGGGTRDYGLALSGDRNQHHNVRCRQGEEPLAPIGSND